MTDLTEKWKKGELPSGWYWVEGSRAEGIYAYTAEYLNNMYRPRNSEKVLAEVPSYEKWQASEKYNKHFEVEIKEKETQRIELMTRLNDVNNENHALEIENAKLKELLKECIAHLTLGEFGTSVTPLNILLDEIDNAIGEKK